MVESLTLSLAGGLLGVGLAYSGLRALLAYGPANLPWLNEITIDLPILLFAAATSVLSGLLFGLAPIAKVVGQKFAVNLREFVRVGGRWARAGKSQHRSQNALVIVQVALALVLLVSSGLMIRTFQNLRKVEPGFTDPATIQTVRVTLFAEQVAEPERVTRVVQEILKRRSRRVRLVIVDPVHRHEVANLPFRKPRDGAVEHSWPPQLRQRGGPAALLDGRAGVCDGTVPSRH